MQYLDAISKMTEWSVCFQGKPFSITVIQVYSPTSNAEEAEVEWFYLWRPTRPRTITHTKKCPFHHRGLKCKSRKSRTGKFSLGLQNKAGQRLTELCQENTVVKANTLFQQHKRQPYTWTSADGQYQNQIDYILCSQRWRNSTRSAKTRPGADCGSDHEYFMAKFRLKLKNLGKTLGH